MAVVLVVDDEFGIALLLKDVLEDEGHRVLVANNGRQALERALEERPDLVITDYMMPVMDGAVLMERLAEDPRYSDIPVVVMSSMPEEAFAERARRYALYVRKPFKVYEFVDALRDYL